MTGKVDVTDGAPAKLSESEQVGKEDMVGNVGDQLEEANRNESVARDTKPAELSVSSPPEVQQALDIPVVILLGCIGSRKTELAKYAAQKLYDKGLAVLHISDLVKGALKDLEHVDLEALYEGRLVSDEVVNRLIYQAVSDVADKSELVLINGYPLTMEQFNYMKSLFNVKAVALIDYHVEDLEKQFEERQMNPAESKNRINEFVSKTMPVVKEFDDRNVLQIIPGECGSEAIEESIVLLLRGLLDPESVETVEKGDVECAKSEEVSESEPKEEAREKHLDAPVVLIVGAPGSFKSKYCSWLTEHFDGIAHISMRRLITDAIEANPGNRLYQEASDDIIAGILISKKLCFELISQALDSLAGQEYLFLLIEGYPRDLEEMNDLGKLVKNIKLVILIDCTEKFCEGNVRRKMADVFNADEMDAYVSRCIQCFKTNTLPMLKYFDEMKLLRLFEGDKGVEELLPEILNMLETTFGCLKAKTSADDGKQKSNAESGIDA